MSVCGEGKINFMELLLIIAEWNEGNNKAHQITRNFMSLWRVRMPKSTLPLLFIIATQYVSTELLSLANATVVDVVKDVDLNNLLLPCFPSANRIWIYDK